MVLNIKITLGSEFIDNDVLNNYFRLINDNFKDIGREFGEFIIDIYMETLVKPNLSDNMVKLIVWVIGEIGS
jgi:AP-4 complex subunit epsilon-1